MRRPKALLTAIVSLAVLVGCGPFATPARTASVRSALASAPELLEFETTSGRQDLFREMARNSGAEAGRAATQSVLFPISRGAELTGAPGFDARADFFQASDGGAAVQLSFEDRGEDRWPTDRRDSLQGLSEREAVEVVARSLLTQWGVSSTQVIKVDRVAGAPYAVAYVDGILRVNPSFLYLAASVGSASASSAIQ